jgi:PAS domain S-box-containing protein
VAVSVSLRALKDGHGRTLIATNDRDRPMGVLGESLERVAASEARYQALMEQANDAILIMDLSGQIRQINRETERLLGWPRAQILGRQYEEFVVPEEREEVARLWRKFVAEGRVFVGNRQFLRADGSTIFAEVSASIVRLGEESTTLTILRDITGRRRAEQEIAERMELAAFTSDIGAALIRDEPLPVVLQQCAEAMMLHLEAAFARIWTLDRAGDTLELQASAGMYTHLDGPHARVPVGQLQIGLIAAEREPHVTNDVMHDPRVSDQAWARREGMVAFAGYPLVVGDRVVGVMAMFARHPLSPNARASMAAVANLIALGIKRKGSEEEQRASEERYRLLFESNPHSLWVYDQETFAFLAVNDAALRHYGYSRAEFLAMTALDIESPAEVPAFREEHETLVAQQGLGRTYRSPHTFKHRRKDGAIIEVDLAANSIVFEGRKAWLLLATDVTEKRSLEAQLQQSQKMESIGRLAGGVAHDFNNLLGIITGYSELLRKRVGTDPRLVKYVDDIIKAAERAAGLTRQLLAFSRKQVLQPRILDLNAVVAETETMLRRLIGEDIQLMTVLDGQLSAVRADPGQMDQVLMNLAVNARDAMPRGGRLTIETGNVVLDQAYARQHAGVEPGRYVMLAVSDTGQGMTPEVRARSFEPFFTTKAQGKGTGLGLATVHGIVRQSGGHIWLYSEPGQGTTFKIYLPRTDAPAAVEAAVPAEAELPSGSETILIVEDEASLRELVRECLEVAGYTVLEAGHGMAALEVGERHPGRIDLLLTDVVMPGMSGRELAERLRAARPEIRTVYMSGYTDDAVVLHGILAEDMAFLQKAFTAAALAHRVREVLDRPADE